MARIIAQHPENSAVEKTFLAQSSAAAATSLSVKNTVGFAVDDHIIIGKIGNERSEISGINTVTPPDTLAVDATLFPHPVDTPICYIKYTQVKFYRATEQAGSYSVIATLPIKVDYPDGTIYDDTSGSSTSWYKVTYYNPVSDVESEASDSFQAEAGVPEVALRGLQDATIELLDDPTEQRVSRRALARWLNECYRKMQRKLQMLDQYSGLITATGTTTTSVFEKDLPSTISQIFKVEAKFGISEFKEAIPMDLRDDQDGYVYDAYSPRYYFLGNQIGFRPKANGDYKIWGYTVPVSLVSDGDELIAPYRNYPEIFENYAAWKHSMIYMPEKADAFKGAYEESARDFLNEVAPRQVQKNRSVIVTDLGLAMSRDEEI